MKNSIALRLLMMFVSSITLGQPMKTYASTVSITHINSIPLEDGASAIAWSQDGTRLAAIHANGEVISVWDSSGSLLRNIRREETLGPYSGPIAFLPGGHVLIGPAPTKTPGRQANTFALWDVDTGKITRLIPGPAGDSNPYGNRPTLFTLSPDGSIVAAVMRNVISLYSTRSWSILARKPIMRADLPLDYHNDKTPPNMIQSINSMAFSSTTLLAVGTARGVALLNSQSALAVTGFIPSIDGQNLVRPIRPLAFSPDGRALAFGIVMSITDSARVRTENDGNESELERENLAYLKIWDVSAQRVADYDTNISTPVDLEWSMDGQVLVALTIDGHLRLYHPAQRIAQPYLQFGLNGRPVMAKFSADGKILAVLLDTRGAPSIEIYRITVGK